MQPVSLKHIVLKRVSSMKTNENDLMMERIYKEYYPKVVGYVRSKVSSPDDGEDICSNIMMKVMKGLPGFDPAKASLATWIFAIARNAVIDYYRQRKAYEELDENIPCASDDFETIFKEDALEELARALRKLSEQERNVIVLHYYRNMTLKDIASSACMSYSNIKKIHARGLLHLKSEIGQF